LLERLSVIPLYLPPLRERKDDILLLADHFLEKFASRTNKCHEGLSEPAKSLVLQYSFPGNVRELENTIERAVMVSNHEGRLEPWDLCGFPSCPYLGGLSQPACRFCSEETHLAAPRDGRVEDLAAARDQFERQHILKVLERTRANKTEAARILGVSRKALWEKCKRYGITKGTNGVQED
jgi:two-component system response regulator HydG